MKNPFFLIVLCVGFFAFGGIAGSRLLDTQLMVAKKPMPRLPDLAPIEIELSRLKKDLDVCHQRVTDAFFAIDVVSRVLGKRVHAPRTPKRVRP